VHPLGRDKPTRDKSEETGMTRETMSASVAPPPDTFNVAAFLLDCNASRAGKTAFVDDTGALSYGDLAERVRRCAAAILALGVRREERVLLLMQDTRDWPVVFLGALYAGVVPVAVNTLLPADDYGYMLGHSRAQAVFVSASLLPTLTAAMGRGTHEVRHVIVSGGTPAADREPGTPCDLDTLISGEAALPQPAPTRADEPARPAGPRAPCTRTPAPTGRPNSTAARSLACARTTCASRRPSCSSPTASAMR
jgi:acyl-CoA synthetase (AMP-forming)/AMP-acid ligase II